ncbi:SRPBCC domain-containing protein [Promineifilum sp.]|uniref:SRPBCC domain-containing protein n=1 Tax=Promineifilum sp. TaxID=2664178 RepID=UPI0035B0E9E4
MMDTDLDPADVSNTSSEATERATGKPWDEWMALLDAAGGRGMTHKQLVAYLAMNRDVSPWWQQQIAVAYENSRRLRQKHEMADGYQISRSRTVAAAAARVYAAWADDAERARWLPDAVFTVRTASPPRRLRLTWSDGSIVEVQLTEKGPARTQVTVQQNKLPDGETAERMKGYWGTALGRLQDFVEAA